MAPFFTGIAKSLGGFGISRTSGVSDTSFNALISTDVFTSPFTSSSRVSSKVEFIAVGGGGGTTLSGSGGQGGISVARFTIPTTTTLLYAVGAAGQAAAPGAAGGAGWSPTIGYGGSGYSSFAPAPLYSGAGGGGLTGVFNTPSAPGITQATALIIAGGGGGNRYNGGLGGNGGGTTADAAPTPGSGTGGGGGSQVSGGAGGLNQPGAPPATATNGGQLVGGDGSSVPAPIGPLWAYGGGGGGAGYYGGGGGGGSNSTSGGNSAGGGGGSGYINTSSPLYVPSPAVERNYTGMGDPGGSGVGGPYPLGAGKNHPQIAPYWASAPTQYGNSAIPGVLIVNYYN